MAKGRSKGNREVKKPKTDKKVAPAGATFLRPQPAGAKTAPKDPPK
jgi:hypothetical protein